MKNKVKIAIFVLFLIFILGSLKINFIPGIQIGKNFVSFVKSMIVLLPCTFLLLGLFDVWIKRETIQEHLGDNSGIRGIFWAIVLAGTSVGGLIVAFPVAASLYKKGAGLMVIFTYLGAAAICRIPMTLFEATFLGVKFTLIRWIISIPLVILSSFLLSKFLSDKGLYLKNQE